MGIAGFCCDLAARLFDHDEDTASELIPASSSNDLPSAAGQPCLPAEIVVAILEAAAQNGNAQKTLAACARVCTAWTAPAQKVLYRRVSLASASALQGFLYALSRRTPRAAMLAASVVSLRVLVDTRQPDGIALDAFANAVALCPQLVALGLAVYDGAYTHSTDGQDASKPVSPLFNEGTLALLRSGPRIASLRLDNWTQNTHALAQLLSAFPSISSLSIAGTPPAAPAPSPFLPEAPPCTLRALRLDCQTAPAPEALAWLLHDAALSSLDVVRAPDCETIAHLLHEHGAALEHLALPDCASAHHAAALARCTRLRTLRLADLWAAPDAALRVPPRVAQLAFALGARTPVGPVLRAVRGGAVRRVVVHVWEGGAGHPGLAELRVACAVGGVELEVARDVWAFRAL